MFTSTRERRLWAATAAVLFGIYATLGLARTLADELRTRELIDAAWVTGLIVMVGALAIVAVRTRPGRREIAIGVAIAAAYVMLFARLAIPEERTHLIEYSLVAALMLEALRERQAGGARVPAPAFIAVGATALVGAIDEGIQWLLPNRVFDPVDMLFNLLAALVAVAGVEGLRRARGRTT